MSWHSELRIGKTTQNFKETTVSLIVIFVILNSNIQISQLGYGEGGNMEPNGVNTIQLVSYWHRNASTSNKYFRIEKDIFTQKQVAIMAIQSVLVRLI